MALPKTPSGMVTGRLRLGERKRIADLLAQRGFTGNKACELCGAAQWSIGSYVVTMQGLARYPNGLEIAPGDPIHPAVAVSCDNCGNTKTINLVILGAMEMLYDPDIEDD